jgi:phosphoglucosamine mutase
MANDLFGTDGARGVANSELTCETAFRLGEAAVEFAGPDICLGRDTRKSGVMLESALTAGIMSAGGTPHCAGVVPTPAVALLTRELGCGAGIVISASHNPPEYNGIKFFSSKGMKLPDATEDRIAEFVLGGGDEATPAGRPVGAKVGCIEKIKDARERYISHAISTIGCDLSGLRVAVDCAHGASCKTTPTALRRLGAVVTAINTDYDGTDINVGCGSTHLGPITELVRRTGADIGLAHDGDADRVLFVDENGSEIDGDFVLAICGTELASRGELPGNEIVSTVMCNLGFTTAMRAAGIDVVQTAVGDRYVLERMIEDGAVIGGEQSGHIIFLDHNSTGDGLITALQVLAAMKTSGKKASELAGVMERFPQSLVNVETSRGSELDASEAIAEAVRAAEAELAEAGRVLVRASGTEPLVRVMVEAKSEERARGCANAIAEVVERELG